jgi:simple sugar transport system ATP-binding protein
MESTDFPFVALSSLGKKCHNINFLRGVHLKVRHGDVTCILGGNGAGKSTLRNFVVGHFSYDDGAYPADGEEVRSSSPREASDWGVVAVYQTVVLTSKRPVLRKFILGSEVASRLGLLGRLENRTIWERTQDALAPMGTNLEDLELLASTPSGGQLQAEVISRAIHFAARVFIIDGAASPWCGAGWPRNVQYSARGARAGDRSDRSHP